MHAELREKVARLARWVGVRLSIARGFVCWCAYRVIPTHGRWYRFGHAFLPFAGDYAFADDPWVKESRSHWIKTGRSLKSEITDGPF